MNDIAPVHFCTCVDYECARHPSNHNKGCAPCIAHNLAKKDIPACFFRKLKPDMDRKQDYSFEGFAKFVRENP